MTDFPVAFGRYQLVERLAVGGMAELFKARVVGAHGFQKPVVIKKILPHLAVDANFVSMFIDEAKITARLEHPKIAQVLELGTIQDHLYIAMEYVEGVDALGVLRACAQRKQPLPAHVAVHIAHEVLDALDYAHQARDDDGRPLGIVHRDISPSNVLISRRGDVKLADFGIAHALDRQGKTQAGMLKGKYGYMSPEQVVGAELDSRSDLFSVGILLAEMLMGRRLFTAPNELDVLLMVRDVKLDRLDKYGGHIEPDLKAIVLRGLARELKNRYPSAGVFRDVLGEWLYSKRQRVTPSELAAFVEGLGPIVRPPQGAPPDAGRGTLVGPATKAKELAVQDQARLARETAEKIRKESSPPPVRPGTPARIVRPRTASDEIPIVIDEPALETAPTAPAAASSVPTAIPPSVVVPVPHAPAAPIMAAGAPAAPAVAVATATDLSGPIVVFEKASAPSPSPEPFEVISNVDTRPQGPLPGPPKVVRPSERPHEEGDLAFLPPIRVLYRLAVDKSTGLLVVDNSVVMKEIYFANGAPEYVASNLTKELLGEYLVAQKVISAAELAMALAMMPHFGGKIGDTLVGLGLLKPLDVFRHLSRQVRDKIVDVCTWPRGTFQWYPGKRNTREAFPLGLDAFEVLGAGATALSEEMMEAWALPYHERHPVAAKNARVVPEAFRLGNYPRDIYNRLDGRIALRQHLARFTSPDDRLAFLRTVYLFVQTDLSGWQ
ncbi:MAG TPA: serine/threonine-protein kinase [Haliangiales bacterium]|nr:serine/threonine-protein kinase [Haliangiales bacterium]